MFAPRIARYGLVAVALALILGGAYLLGGTPRPLPDAPASDTSVDAVQQARLRALGYLGWHEESPAALAKSGVTVHQHDRTAPGLNLYCSEPSGVLRFIGMDGTEVHTIDLGMDEDADPDNYCKVATPHGDDTIVAVLENTKLIKFGLDGKPRWALDRSFHHDVQVGGDGRIVAVVGRQIASDDYFTEHAITDSVIVILDANGKFLQTFSLAALVARVPALLERAHAHLDDPSPHWKADEANLPDEAGAKEREWRRHDVFHVNTVALLPRALPLPDGGEAPAGSILFCARHLDSIGIIDPTTENIVWHWGIGELQWPHHPSLLANGHILVFDNGIARQQSRLLELDPATNATTWRYEPGPTFFSRSRGSAQRLPGGHTLVTESTRGRVFEIDEAGEIVWEFLNPHTDPASGARATIFRMTRLPPERVRTMHWPPSARAHLTKLGLPTDH